VDLYTKMLEQGQSLRRQRKTYRELNEKLFKFWDDYNKQHLTSKDFLEKCANIYTHFNAIKYAKTANDARVTEIETE
jgi:hypothetical protein